MGQVDMSAKARLERRNCRRSQLPVEDHYYPYDRRNVQKFFEFFHKTIDAINKDICAATNINRKPDK